MRQAVILAGILFLLGLVCCYKTHTNTKKSEKHSGLLHQESYGVGDKIRPKRFIGLIIFGIACIFLCGRGNSRSSPNSPPPNRPPSIECPRIEQEYTANDGETWKFVEWGEIKAKDPEDGKLKATLTFGLPSGSRFERGIHAIRYSATDKHGLKGFCSLHFRVIVKTCDHPRPPTDGSIWCAKSEIPRGTTCTVTCRKGFKLNPPSRENITCGKKGFPAIPLCKKVTCPKGDLKIKPKHGRSNCIETSDSTICNTECSQNGFVPERYSFTVCNANGQWSAKLPDCKDKENPEIYECPNHISTFANRNNQPVIVNWEKPKAKDNSDIVKLEQTMGQPSGSLFSVGKTEIRYQAIDGSGNKSPYCTFLVDVEELRCNPPLITDRYMFYKCPHGFTYGSECSLVCKGKFPLVGNETIVCEKNSTSVSTKGYWEKGDIEPFCKLNPCKNLPAPINGAISCDRWMFGRQCQMQCSDKYDIPAVGSGFTGIFTCSDKEGIFKPLNTVPNCTEKRLPGHIETLGEFFYYLGSCEDKTVLEQIKSNFINQMEILEQNGFAGVCSDAQECNVGNVSVTCGQTNRKRRSVEDFIRFKRSSYEIRVEIKISSAWENTNSSQADSFKFAKQIQKEMFQKIKDISESGKLTVKGFAPSTDSFVLGYSVPTCTKGLLIRMDTLSCVPCVSGTFLNKDHRGRPVCTSCPKGFYKDDEYATHCTQCQVGKSTVDRGSTLSADCIDKCGPGEYSDTGLVPCIPCAKSTYSNDSMSKRCIQCPLDMTTEFSGSTDIQNCSRFDVMLKGGGNKFYLNKSPELIARSNLTFMTWFGLSDITANVTLFHSKGLNVRIQNDLFIEKDVRNWQSLNVSIQNGTWMHVAVVLQKISPFVSVFLNGKSKPNPNYNVSLTEAEMASAFEDICIFLNSTIDSGVYLSGYHVVPRALSHDEILQSTKSCHANIFDSIISMDDLRKKSGTGLELIVPSQCSSVNECANNPCNGHQCLQKISGYACQCSNGFHGTHCELKPDYCKQDPCQNGASCNNTEDGKYTCLCPEGFKGIRCEKHIVNGGWSLWGQFSECSVTCNGGTKFRTRICNNPTPDPEGISCNTSEATEISPCSEQQCPTCPIFKRTFGAIPQCEQRSDGHIVCNVTCRPGYSFIAGNTPLPEYTCGFNTSYVWNGEPPACGRIDIPVLIATETEVSYNAPLECSKASKASQNLRMNLESSLQCAQNKTCTVNVEAKDCTSSSRKKRSALTQNQLVTLTSITVENGAEGSGESDKASDSVTNFVNAVSDLELSMQQLNSTNDMLNLEIDGKRYTSTGKTFQSVVNCPDGQGRNTYFCVYCSPGTYSSSGSCILCNKGSYQDESGQTSCKPCPYGWSTQYIGSQSQQECSENVMEKSNPSYPEEDENKTLVIIISCAVCIGFIIVLLGTCFGINRYRKYKRQTLSDDSMKKGNWIPLNTDTGK